VYALRDMGNGSARRASSRPAPAPRPPRRARSAAAGLVRAALSTAGLACVAIVVVTPLDLRTQAALAAGMFVLSLVVGRVRGATARLALVVLSVTATARYLYWRVTATIAVEWTVDAALGAVLLAAELYACAMLVLAYFQSLGALRRRPVPLPDDCARWPTVDVFIPTYNEPLEVVRATVLAAKALDWPRDRLRVLLLDDGRREAFRAFASAAGVGYVVRPDNAHAKAGNLNHALGLTSGELIAIFDCDHVPTRSFLQMTAGGFLRDPRLALVQTPHHFYSPDPFTRNLGTPAAVPGENDLFYGLIQCGLDTWNAAFFCGSCAVLRRSALLEVGGIAIETVTEDAHTALKLHRRGWRSAYLAVPQAAGLATETLSAHVGQRIRWARGMAQMFRLDNPLLGRGLRPSQRFSYLAAMLHFFSGIPRLVFLLVPMAYLLFGRHVFNALPLAAVAYGLPHLFHSTATSSRLHGRFRHSLWSEVYETALASYIAVPTTIALVAPRAGRFNVTAKGGRIERAFFDARIALPYLLLAAANLAAIAAGGLRLWTGAGEVDALAINLAWAFHNVVVLAATMAAACERVQRRASPRVTARLAGMLRLGDGRTLRCETRDLALGGGRVELAADTALERGERVWLSVFSFDDEHPLPADVVAREGRAVRLRFASLTLEEEGHLVRVLFSRADAWLGWADALERDHPLVTLARIARHAAAGVGRLLLVAARPAAPAPRAPAALRREP
jgi:cellulose synthase (UDP-forming)